MKRSFIIIMILLFAVAQTGYSQRKSSRKKDVEKELTEKERYTQSDMFMQAMGEKSLNNLDKALELLDKSLEINDKDAASHYEKARILQQLGRTDQAMEEAQIASDLDKSNKWYSVLLANISKSNDQYDTYVAIYEDLVDEYPEDLNFLNELAYAYYFTGDYENAVVIYDRIEEQIGINEGLSTQKVQLYARSNNIDKAIEEYEKLIATNPDEPRYYALLAEFCTKNNREDKAIWAYEKIVELDPNDPYVHISLAEYYKNTGNDLKAYNELKKGMANPKLNLETKINLLFNYYSGNLTDDQRKQALELSEILKKTHPDEVLGETFYASMLFENKEYEEARGIFREILEVEAANYAYWEQLLFCDLYLEDYGNLAKDAEDAIDFFPSYPLPYFFAGVGNFQLKDFAKAQAYLETGKDFVVNNNALLEQFYSTIGDTYNELGNYDASYAAYDKVLSLNPTNAIVLNNYAYYLSLRSEKLDKAEKMARQAVDSDPYNSNNLDTYAWVLYKQEKYEMALEWIQKAHSNGGETSGVVLEHYGDILYKLDQKEEAMEFWKKAKLQSDYSGKLDEKLKDGKLYE